MTSPSPDPTSAVKLTTLGGLRASSSADGQPSAKVDTLNSRRRVMAVLTVLALAPAPLSRDLLADYFWPDSDPQRARRSLAESLSFLRGVLGAEAIATRAQLLSLETTIALEVDAVAFRSAVARGDWQAAVSQYAGPFLDGVYIERAPRFEDWVAREREQFAEQFGTACDHECARLQGLGRHQDAAILAQCWLDSRQLSELAAIAWLSALAAPGTRAALRTALEKYAQYRDRLLAEYDMEPDAPVAELAASIRTKLEHQLTEPHADAAMGSVGDASDAGSAGRANSRRGDTRPSNARHGDTPTTNVVSGKRTPPMSLRVAPAASMWLAARWLLIPLAAVLWIGWRVLRRPETSNGATAGPTLVVVADAEIGTTDSTLGPAVTLAMATALSDSRTVRVLSKARVRRLRQLAFASDTGRFDEQQARIVAQRSGAGAVVVPVVVALGPRYLLSTRILTPSTGQATAVLEGAPVDSTQLLVALNELVGRARRAFGERTRPSESGAPLPELTTTSLTALRLYAAGSEAAARFQYDRARELYKRAIAADSTFALAHTQLGASYAFGNQPTDAEREFLAADRYRARLTPREQMIVKSTIHRWRSQPDSAIAVRQAWLRVQPDDDDIASQLAYDLLADKRFGAAIAQYERLVASDSMDANAFLNLAVSYSALMPNTPRARALDAYSRAFQLDTGMLGDPQIMQSYTSLLVDAGRVDSAAAVMRRATVGGPVLRARMLRALGQLALWEGQPARAIAPLRESMGIFRANTQPLGQLRSQLQLTHAMRYIGDSVGARAERAAMQLIARTMTEPAILYWVGQEQARAGSREAAQELLDSLKAHAVAGNPVHAAAESLLAGEIAIARGNMKDGLRLLTAGIAKDSNVVTYESLAYGYERAGNLAEARVRYEALANTGLRFGWEGSTVQRMAPIRAAQLAQRAGDTTAAARWLAMAKRAAPKAEPVWPPRNAR